MMTHAIRRALDPMLFQGSLRRRRYFEGWYFKHVAADGGATFAFIPGVSLSRAGSSAFVQLIDGATGRTRWFPYPLEEFSHSRHEFSIAVGDSRFSLRGIDVRLRDGEGEVEAHLAYTGITPLPWTPGAPNIMGPYAYVPFLECYHGVGSLDHRVDGEVRVGARRYDFGGGRGYLEKDWGRSMPLAWIWAQANGFAGQGSCLLFSLARIPWLGRSFPGFFALLAEGSRERGGRPVIHRFATYTGARVAAAELRGRDLRIEVRDRTRVLRLHVERSRESTLSPDRGGVLLAPVDGAMDRRIAESIDARIRVRLEQTGGRLLFEGDGGNAGLEIVGDPSLIDVKS